MEPMSYSAYTAMDLRLKLGENQILLFCPSNSNSNTMTFNGVLL